MSIPQRLSKRFREVLGTDAGDDLMTLLNEQRSESVQLRREIAEFRDEVRSSLSGLEVRLIERISDVKSDLMKWSFVFWCGAVAAIAALAGVLRH